MDQKINIEKFLADNGVDHTVHTHDPFLTMEDAMSFDDRIGAVGLKNVLVETAGGLLIAMVMPEKRIDFKAIKALGYTKPKLWKFHEGDSLDLGPQGSLSIFDAVVNPGVGVLVDKEIFSTERVAMHPRDNSQTVEFATLDFKRLVEELSNSTRIAAM
jgi:hypothetical protein